MQKQLQIFALARVCADTYEKEYNKADKKRKEAWNDLNRNFVKGSPKFIEYRDSIEPTFQEKIKKTREKVIAEFEAEFEDLRKTEIEKVKIINSGSEKMMDILGRLENIPISVDEFNYLAEQYGNHGYWVDRYLSSIGKKNGMQEIEIQPDITTKLSVLEELKSNLYGFFDKYKNDNSYSSDVLVAEERKKQFERDFLGMSLLDIFSSGQISRTRREVIRELIQAGAGDETVKGIICPELTEAEVQEKKRAWLEMQGK